MDLDYTSSHTRPSVCVQQCQWGLSTSHVWTSSCGRSERPFCKAMKWMLPTWEDGCSTNITFWTCKTVRVMTKLQMSLSRRFCAYFIKLGLHTKINSKHFFSDLSGSLPAEVVKCSTYSSVHKIRVSKS